VHTINIVGGGWGRLSIGLYALFYEKWLEHFSPDQFLVARLEDYTPFKFLGFDEPENWDQVLEKVNFKSHRVDREPLLQETEEALNHYIASFLESSIILSFGQKLIDLALFSGAISKYEGIRETIQQFQFFMDVVWLRINKQPIKSQLMTWTSKWVDLFVSYLKFTVKLSSLDRTRPREVTGNKET
jgi:hypothetical protein